MQYHNITTAIFFNLKVLSIDGSCLRRISDPCMPVFFQPVLLSEKCSKIIHNILKKNNIVRNNTNTIKLKICIDASKLN